MSLGYTAVFNQDLFLEKTDNQEPSACRVYRWKKSLSVPKMNLVYHSIQGE